VNIAEVARRVQSRSLTAVAVAQAAIEKVHARNADLNAIIQFDANLVLQEAANVDQQIAKGETLPLAGVVFTAKDNLWVKGRRISQGSQLFFDFIAPRDAWAVARCRELGAVLLGITNCSEFACKGITENLLYGATRHPHNPELTPGGSSGGAVAALAAGMGHFALATDAGGSTRRPAAHCGLVGFKPSPGLIPHPWGFVEPNFGQSVIGLITHTVEDNFYLFKHLAKYDAADSAGVPIEVDWSTQPQVNKLRIAWSLDLGLNFAIDDGVKDSLQTSIATLRAAGIEIGDAAPKWPDLGGGEYPLLALQQAGLHALYGWRLAKDRALIDPDLVVQIEAGAKQTPARLMEVLRLQQAISRSLSRFFDDYDLLLCPTSPVVAWKQGLLGPATIGGRPASARGHAAFTPFFNACGVPACSVPVGKVDGLPVGIQVVAPRFEDASVLAFSTIIERLHSLDTNYGHSG
jgi:aspartyl-tRNA(Asn)/glutamyl-tRNA(Gln) amidotransferase subunit A